MSNVIIAVPHKSEITVSYIEESDGVNMTFKNDPTTDELGDEFFIPTEDLPAVISALQKLYDQVTGKS
ncbi:hypothetical protein [Serratia marcescens]|uniref:hypothetical protein n=1 Tax=Serratia marcescens TaxID=615 RepID=UPI000411A232|nr:hypothetical protein [Serratia marcescens]MBH3014685.1 hypothetical protein [Serratia marcescens]MDM3535664.1 hypothetical protein [Serratia marcescens]MDM3540748.1 hypothetical protein [Serratia marcescens]